MGMWLFRCSCSHKCG